jgi:hypothetical protein
MSRRPNILYIMSDDHAAHAIGAYGSRINATPQMDRLGDPGPLSWRQDPDEGLQIAVPADVPSEYANCFKIEMRAGRRWEAHGQCRSGASPSRPLAGRRRRG